MVALSAGDVEGPKATDVESKRYTLGSATPVFETKPQGTGISEIQYS